MNESLSCHIKQALEILFGKRGQPSVAHPFYENIYENGKIKDWVYYIYDEPCACYTADETDVENSDFYDSQDTDFSDTETDIPTAFCKTQNNIMVLEAQFT
ncbi:MAG: hypothetical protein IJ555_14105 [Ruminococcus sp.]|nr:hypothetical protein [Ruminococcus sp.]